MDHPAFPAVVARIAAVCEVAGPQTMLSDLRRGFRAEGLTAAVIRHDTPVLFDWLMRVLSLQGVSDAVAWGYMDQHGSVSFAEIEAGLTIGSGCSRLRSYWHFDACRYAKQAFSCGAPEHIETCPLPLHDLRNGRLNQTAYNLALFLRDVCRGDLVAWIDERLTMARDDSEASSMAWVREALLGPLSSVYGVSYKVLSMALADLLLAGDPDRHTWVSSGAGMVAIDTLVHNWLHRTGSLRDLHAEHPYVAGCYAPGGCADIVQAASHSIDARAFCPEGPAVFLRLLQRECLVQDQCWRVPLLGQ